MPARLILNLWVVPSSPGCILVTDQGSTMTVAGAGVVVDLRQATLKDLPIIHYNDGTTSISGPATNDALDRLLTRIDLDADPLKLTDPKTGAPFLITAEEAALIQRMEAGYAGTEDFDPFQPYVDFFTQHRLTGPLVKRSEPKGRFAVSKWETKRIHKLVLAIRRGYIKKNDDDQSMKQIKPMYDIWETTSGNVDAAEPRAAKRVHVPAPKLPLPGHELSYNPPDEYLLTAQERAEWDMLPEAERVYRPPLPCRFKSLRLLPLYSRLIHERFSRCLDLYLCPRVVKQRLDISDPDALLPELPSPDSLKPYPMARSTEFLGHDNPILSIDIHSSGQWLASADKAEIRIWDTLTGRCVFRLPLPATCVSWCPRSDVALLAIGSGQSLHLLAPTCLPGADVASALVSGPGSGTAASLLKWHQTDSGVYMDHEADISIITWHPKGDYLACLLTGTTSLASSVVMHQLSRRTSQQPFGRLPSGQPRGLAFASGKPYLVLTTNQHIRIYDLISQRLVKRLSPTTTRGLSLTVPHPSSPDNYLAVVGDRLSWFDIDLSSLPYRTLQLHSTSIQTAVFSPTFPLFASAASDGLVQVVHARVYEELDRSATIVPVRTLRELEGRVVHSLVFHPNQPWLYGGDSSGIITVFV